MKGYIVVPVTFMVEIDGLSDDMMNDLIDSGSDLTKVSKLYVNVNNISSFNQSSIEGHCTLRLVDDEYDVHLTVDKLMDLITKGQETLK